MDKPPAVACTAPQAPSTRPVSSRSGSSIAVSNMLTENRPLEKPISAAPTWNRWAEFRGAEKITQAKAGKPSKAPMAARRMVSSPRDMKRADSTKASKAPPALMAVSELVRLTLRFSTWPP